MTKEERIKELERELKIKNLELGIIKKENEIAKLKKEDVGRYRWIPTPHYDPYIPYTPYLPYEPIWRVEDVYCSKDPNTTFGDIETPTTSRVIVGDATTKIK